jgi:cell wall-active antibiotic response 4TMS protein YvqF
MSHPPSHRRHNGSLIVGTAILLFGLALLLDEAGIIEGPGYATFWSLVIATVGVFKLSQRRADGTRHGIGWVVTGVLLWLTRFRFDWLRQSWPLLLVAVGIAMVWKDLARMRTHERVE